MAGLTWEGCLFNRWVVVFANYSMFSYLARLSNSIRRIPTSKKHPEQGHRFTFIVWSVGSPLTTSVSDWVSHFNQWSDSLGLGVTMSNCWISGGNHSFRVRHSLKSYTVTATLSANVWGKSPNVNQPNSVMAVCLLPQSFTDVNHIHSDSQWMTEAEDKQPWLTSIIFIVIVSEWLSDVWHSPFHRLIEYFNTWLPKLFMLGATFQKWANSWGHLQIASRRHCTVEPFAACIWICSLQIPIHAANGSTVRNCRVNWVFVLMFFHYPL